jgi:hypothetical protein
MLATSFFFDLAWLVRRNDQLAIVAWWLADLRGRHRWRSGGAFRSDRLDRDPARDARGRVGARCTGGMGIVALLYAASWLLRRTRPRIRTQLRSCCQREACC